MSVSTSIVDLYIAHNRKAYNALCTLIVKREKKSFRCRRKLSEERIRELNVSVCLLVCLFARSRRPIYIAWNITHPNFTKFSAQHSLILKKLLTRSSYATHTHMLEKSQKKQNVHDLVIRKHVGWQWRNFAASWFSPPSCGQNSDECFHCNIAEIRFVGKLLIIQTFS